MELFGFEITKKIRDNQDKEKEKLVSPIPKLDADGASVVSASGYFGQYLDIDGTAISNDIDLIMKYRKAAEQPECDAAISDIVNESIYMGDDGSPVSLDMDHVEGIPAATKKKIAAEFNTVCSLLNFSEDGADIFRTWYIDGRLYAYIIIGEKAEEGIKEVRFVDPLRIKKIREVQKVIDPDTRVEYEKTIAEYFVYSDTQMTVGTSLASVVPVGTPINGIRINPDAMVYVPSGLLDPSRMHVVSHLQKAVKNVNNLNMMENALVIYRMSRAPERRIFYIDVGNLPKGKAEEYVQSIMSKYRNKLVYNASTGEIVDDRKHMSMLEDFWLPRREGGKGTEITTLPGGQNLGDIEDIVYFQRKLYKSLNVPLSRLESDTGFNVGRATEISREEVRFQKFIDKLRRKFSYLFLDLLRVQILLRNIITEEEWIDFKEHVTVDYAKDNYFTELKNFEILTTRIDMLDKVKGSAGQYFSESWIKKNILGLNDQEIKKMEAEMEAEKPEEPANPDSQEDEDKAPGLFTPPDGDSATTGKQEKVVI